MIAAQTSGRSIWVSGLTVIVAMSGMFLTQDATFSSFAVGTILVVATAVLGSLTVLPALLATLGDKVDAIKLPGLYRKRSDGRFWNGLLRVVLAKPLLSALVAVAALGAIAYPALRLNPQAQTLQDLPPKAPVVKALIAVDAAFPSKSSPAQVVIKADSVRDAAFTRTLASFESSARAHHLAEPFDVRINPAGTVAVVSVGLPTKSDLKVLRGEVVPATFGRLSGATALVTGDAAQASDFNRRLDDSLPWVFGFVLGLAFVLLLVLFRSVVVAITGVVLNLLSVAAAYGMLVWVFQDGHFASQLQFTPSGGITNWMPLFLFIILFGLSMDYHIFVLSRIQEGHDRGLPTGRRCGTGSVARPASSPARRS